MKYAFSIIIIIFLGSQNLHSQNAICQDVTVSLDANGNAIIDYTMVDGGSNGNGPLTFTLSQSAFNCADLGVHDITMTVTETMTGSMETCVSMITVVDLMQPIVICNDVNNWSLSQELSAADVGSYSDNCSITSTQVLPSTFSQPGDYSVTLVAFDAGGSANTCISFVHVIGEGNDNEAPTITQCVDLPDNVDSNESCEYVLEDFTNLIVAQDNVTAVDDLVISQSPVPGTILSGGTQHVLTFTVMDEAGISSTCFDLLYIVDNINPTIVNCPQDQTINYYQGITFPDFGAEIGAYDNCTDNFQLNVVQTPAAGFSPNPGGGLYDMQLQVIDESGNTTNCNFVLTIFDESTPVTAICQDVDVILDATGSASVLPTSIDGGSFSSGNIASITLSQSNFDCSEVGPNLVTLTVTNEGGSSATCNSVVTVMDTTNPQVACQDVTLNLNGNGNAVLTISDVVASESDNCSSPIISMSQTEFTSVDLGINNVMVTATDASGNMEICTAIVTISDSSGEGPFQFCNGITTQLDQTGQASVTAEDVVGSIDGYVLSIDQSDFSCSDVGVNFVTISATDANDNVATCATSVTIADVIPPTIVCSDVTVALDATGNVSITTGIVTQVSFDECGFAVLSLSISDFDCSNVGANIVELTATDASNNTASCMSTVTVIDVMNPIAICEDITVGLDNNGTASIVANEIDNGSYDSCGISSIVTSQTDFEMEDIGDNAVELTVVDMSGNASSCTSTVTVIAALPSLTCPGDLTLDGNDECVVVLPSFESQSVISNFCTPVYTQSPPMGTEINSPTLVTVTVSDDCDNTMTCTFMVTTNGLAVELMESNGVLSTTIDADNYQWNTCGGNPIPGANSATYTPQESGSYSLSVIDASCSGTSDCIDVIFVGIDELSSEFQLELYPNPNNGQFSLNLDAIQNNTTIYIYNEMGQNIYSEKIGDNTKVNIDLSGQSAGLYLLHLSGDKGNTKRHFIIE